MQLRINNGYKGVTACKKCRDEQASMPIKPGLAKDASYKD